MIGSERAGKAVRVCVVALTAGTALLPAAAAHAAPVAEYEYNFRDVFSGGYRQTIPFEANVSTTSVAGAGETVNFRFSLRADQWQPGWLYPLDAFKLRVDLSRVADDVLDIEDVLDTLEATPMNGLTMEVVGNTVEFYGEFDEDAPRQFEVKFSVDVAPAEMDSWEYLLRLKLVAPMISIVSGGITLLQGEQRCLLWLHTPRPSSLRTLTGCWCFNQLQT